MTTGCTGLPPIAHSARNVYVEPDPYARHVHAVWTGARERAEAMAKYGAATAPALLAAIDAAATFHDLGKLDPDNQAALRGGRTARLPWDHIDAGVAHLSALRNWMAAWLIRAHHAPGLPAREEHFNRDFGRRLRGRRRSPNAFATSEDSEQIARTDKYLQSYIIAHNSAVGGFSVSPQRPTHGLTMRLALSCLVDADYSDSAFADSGTRPTNAPPPRWAARLDALRRHVHALPQGTTAEERARNVRRRAFFESCLEAELNERMVTCEGPVGIGKTTAIAAYLIRRARDEGLRRIILVAPYTTILTQTARKLRVALRLEDESPEEMNGIVAEHHHRADFEHQSDREVAALWNAPIVLTTAVSFFETLAASTPATLRKLHAVPGSAIWIDEAHAAIPTKLWPQNWCWLRELAEQWQCPTVFASGSLVRFWETAGIVQQPVTLSGLLRKEQEAELNKAERHRVRYERLGKGNAITPEELATAVRLAPGPRLVILNTVQSAAVTADVMRVAGIDVLHLSTALIPADRARILQLVGARLMSREDDWVLVATSCVEAGVDLSFRTGFRERFAVGSTLQVGGRVNRHSEYDAVGGGTVYDFAITGGGTTQHPGAAVSAAILRELMVADALNHAVPADLVTCAMRRELLTGGPLAENALLKAEAERDYPRAQEAGRVIDADTRLVVVADELRERLERREPTSFSSLMNGSVQLWASRIEKLGLEPLAGRDDIYVWNDLYDRDFLGIMAGLLRTAKLLAAGGIV